MYCGTHSGPPGGSKEPLLGLAGSDAGVSEDTGQKAGHGPSCAWSQEEASRRELSCFPHLNQGAFCRRDESSPPAFLALRWGEPFMSCWGAGGQEAPRRGWLVLWAKRCIGGCRWEASPAWASLSAVPHSKAQREQR